MISGLIVDFYCAEVRLAVELDGEFHGDRQEYDAARDAALLGQDILVLRLPNRDVDQLAQRIQETLLDR